MRKPFSPSERLQVRTMPLSTGTHYTITYIRRSHGPMDTPAEISRTLVCFPITCRNTGSRCSSLAGTISRALASGENQLYPEHQSSPSSRRCITQASEEQCNHPSNGSGVSLCSHVSAFHLVPPHLLPACPSTYGSHKSNQISELVSQQNPLPWVFRKLLLKWLKLI